MQTKICSRCKVEKSVVEFNKCKKYNDGFHYNCKECTKTYYKNYHTLYPDKKRRYSKKYKTTHVEKILKYNKKYNKKYYLNNKETVIKQYKKNNIDKIKEQTRKYRENHQEEKKIINTNYCKLISQERKNNPNLYKDKDLKRSFGKDFGLEQYNKILEIQNGCCYICKQVNTSTKHKNSNEIRALAVDHNHATGTIRGLLCDKCNRGLGYFNDNAELLLIAASYLKQYQFDGAAS